MKLWSPQACEESVSRRGKGSMQRNSMIFQSQVRLRADRLLGGMGGGGGGYVRYHNIPPANPSLGLNLS